jgi:hypothetical protein
VEHEGGGHDLPLMNEPCGSLMSFRRFSVVEQNEPVESDDNDRANRKGFELEYLPPEREYASLFQNE